MAIIIMGRARMMVMVEEEDGRGERITNVNRRTMIMEDQSVYYSLREKRTKCAFTHLGGHFVCSCFLCQTNILSV